MLVALGLEPTLVDITFEEQFPTGLTGNPPNLDVALKYPNGRVIGIESKFCEWLTPMNKGKEPFKDKYFAAGATLWKEKGLPKSQQLAEALHTGEECYRHLNVPQLLKHVLGMATQLEHRFSLYYIYYDWAGPESDVHRQEIERFDAMVGEEVRLKAKSYQEFFEVLKNDDDGYVNYLRDRYFSV